MNREEKQELEQQQQQQQQQQNTAITPLDGKWTFPEMGERHGESTQRAVFGSSVQKYVWDVFIPVTRIRKE